MSEAVKKINQIPESYSTNTKPEILKMMEETQKDVDYPESFILTDKSTKVPPDVKHYGPAYLNPQKKL